MTEPRKNKRINLNKFGDKGDEFISFGNSEQTEDAPKKRKDDDDKKDGLGYIKL